MDWGGVIAGAMGGGAQAIGQIADNNLRVREQEASEQRRALFDEQRANRAMDRKLQLEEQQRDMRGKRLMDQQDQISDKATELRQSKNVGSLADTQSRVSGESPSASKDELAGLMADPKNRQIYEDAGYIPKTTASGLVRDRMDAARAIGADPELRKELGQEYQQTTQAEANALKNEREERKLDQKDSALAEERRSNQVREDLRMRQLSAAISKASGGGSGSREALAFLGEERKSLTADKQDLRAREAAVMKAVPDYDKEGKTKAKREFEEANRDVIESIQQRSKFLDGSLSKVRDKVGLGDTDEPRKAEKQPPKPASIPGAPKGHTVGSYVDGKGYEVKDSSGKLIGYARK